MLLERLEQMERRFNEREQQLIERNARLEQRIAELELHVGTTAAVTETAAGTSASSNPVSLTGAAPPDAAVPPTVTPRAESDRSEQPAETSGVSLRPYAFLVASTAYNIRAVVPGSIAFFGVPRVPGVTTSQFSVSAGNTLLGGQGGYSRPRHTTRSPETGALELQIAMVAGPATIVPAALLGGSVNVKTVAFPTEVPDVRPSLG